MWPPPPLKGPTGQPRRALGYGNKSLVSTFPDAESLYDNFLHGLKISANDPFLGTRAVLESGAAGVDLLAA